MSSDLVEKRNFFLMLSIVEGQRLAYEAGFSIPSEDVQKEELMDVIKKWLILSASGILDGVKKCVSWAVETNIIEGITEKEMEQMLDALTAFSVGMLSNLLDNKYLMLSPDLEPSEEGATGFFGELFKSVHEDDDDE